MKQPLKDWNWSKVIGKRDELLWMEVDNVMEDVLIDYLDLADLSEMTEEKLDHLDELVDYLEKEMYYDESSSVHFGSMVSIIQRWKDQWWEGWQDYYG